jgi:hypothetical protein
MLEHYFGCWNSNSNLSSICLNLFQTQALIPKPFLFSYPTPFPFPAHRPLPAQQAAAAQHHSRPQQPSTTASRVARLGRIAAHPRVAAGPTGPAVAPARPVLPRPLPLTGGTHWSSLPGAVSAPDSAASARVRAPHAPSPWPARQGVPPGTI